MAPVPPFTDDDDDEKSVGFDCQLVGLIDYFEQQFCN
jgi:hypothetical protein